MSAFGLYLYAITGCRTTRFRLRIALDQLAVGPHGKRAVNLTVVKRERVAARGISPVKC
jgi:hypothetical protein